MAKSVQWRQVSTVSRRLSLAAARAFATSGSLDLCDSEHSYNFGSALLRSWAPHLTSLEFDEEAADMPGIEAFIGAASSLADIRMVTCTTLATAQAEYLLPCCNTACSLHVTGPFVPSMFPPNMRHIDMTFTDWEAEPDWDDMGPSCLLYKLARQKQLRKICLAFDYMHMLLVCLLHSLSELDVSIQFALDSNTVLDLGWLLLQPCKTIDLHITVCTVLLAQHTMVISQLQQLQVHSLTLVWQLYCPLGIQLLWQQLQITSCLSLWLCQDVCSSAEEALQALPCSPDIEVRADIQRDGSLPVFITWAAVTAQPAKVSLVAGNSPLHLLGQGPVGPPDIQGP